MPIYEYGCEAGHRFEVTQKVSDPPVTTCQACALPVSKLISAPAIMFKGSGWYVTDYSNKLKPPTEGESTSKPAPPAPSTASPATPTTAPPAAGSLPNAPAKPDASTS